MTTRPHYFTVNITVETEDGEPIAVWRSDKPFDNVEVAIGHAIGVAEVAAEEFDFSFDRMDA